jgi:sugar phosphate isomerase/epimerase
MIFDDWYEGLERIKKDYISAGLVCPVVHADKQIGDMMCSAENKPKGKYFDLWKINCNFAAEISTEKIVLHPYGAPDSDTYFEMISERIGALLETAKSFGLDMLVENLVCIHGSPIEHCEAFTEHYPSIGIIIDTRHAQFHYEMERTLASPLWETRNIRHIHINEYAGARKDWSKLYPIPRLGKGDVDFKMFFAFLKKINYTGSITMENPSILENGVDVEFINGNIRFVKKGINTAERID